MAETEHDQEPAMDAHGDEPTQNDTEIDIAATSVAGEVQAVAETAPTTSPTDAVDNQAQSPTEETGNHATEADKATTGTSTDTDPDQLFNNDDDKPTEAAGDNLSASIDEKPSDDAEQAPHDDNDVPGDLFGDVSEDEGTSTATTNAADNLIGHISDDDEDVANQQSQPNAGLYGDDEMEEAQMLIQPEIKVLDPAEACCTADHSALNYRLVKLPNFLSIEPKPFDADSLLVDLQDTEERRLRREELRAEISRRKDRIAAGLEADDSDDDNDDNDDEDGVLGDGNETRRQRRAHRRQSLAELEEEDKGPVDELGRERVKLGDEHAIRWKRETTEDGVLTLSNARMVTWSDGSKSLVLGDEVYDCIQTHLHDSTAHLFANADNLVQAKHVFETRVTFKPAHLNSKAHRKITRTVAKSAARARQTKTLATALNPEVAKREAVRQEDERIRARVRAENKARRQREINAGRVTRDFLEADNYGGVETVVRRGRGRGASRRQQIEEDLEYPMDNENEYEEDEFLVGDDAEIEYMDDDDDDNVAPEPKRSRLAQSRSKAAAKNDDDDDEDEDEDLVVSKRSTTTRRVIDDGDDDDE